MESEHFFCSGADRPYQSFNTIYIMYGTMRDQWYVLFERSFDRKSGPHTICELMQMKAEGKIRNATPIKHADGRIGGGGDSLESLANDMLGGVLLTPRQQAYLIVLGYTGSLYMTQEECTRRIESYRLKGIKTNFDFEDEARKAEDNMQNYLMHALKEHSRGRRLGPSRRIGIGSLILLPLNLLSYLLTLVFKGLFEFVKAFFSVVYKSISLILKCVGLAGKGAIATGKAAAPVIGSAAEAGAGFVKDASTKAIEYEKENKVLLGAASKIYQATQKGAKAGISMIADSLNLDQEEQPIRTWTSLDGRHTIEARLADISETTVRLQKADGSLIDVQKSQLSQVDLDAIAGK